MITKEMIKKGFKNGIISIEDGCIGCMGICCKIGDNAFYFFGSEDDNITKEDYWKSHTLEENGLDDFEIGYYESVLKLMK